MIARLLLLYGILSISSFLSAQTKPASDPQAVAYALQSIAAMVGNVTINDVTLNGTVTWNGTDSGSAILRALGTGESRTDFSLSSGNRTEIRDSQTGVPLGQWIVANNASGMYAYQNSLTDAAWFFAPLGSLANGPNIVLSYIGQETRNGASVQHLQTYVYQSGQFTSPTPDLPPAFVHVRIRQVSAAPCPV